MLGICIISIILLVIIFLIYLICFRPNLRWIKNPIIKYCLLLSVFTGFLFSFITYLYTGDLSRTYFIFVIGLLLPGLIVSIGMIFLGIGQDIYDKNRIWGWKPRRSVLYKPKYHHKYQFTGGGPLFEWMTQVKIIIDSKYDNAYEGTFRVQKNGKCKIILSNFYDYDEENEEKFKKELIILPVNKVKFRKYYFEEHFVELPNPGFKKIWRYILNIYSEDITKREVL